MRRARTWQRLREGFACGAIVWHRGGDGSGPWYLAQRHPPLPATATLQHAAVSLCQVRPAGTTASATWALRPLAASLPGSTITYALPLHRCSRHVEFEIAEFLKIIVTVDPGPRGHAQAGRCPLTHFFSVNSRTSSALRLLPPGVGFTAANHAASIEAQIVSYEQWSVTAAHA
ncbi:hypothetical protein E2C01_097960 [Portunus trituberculatus]|uniref:Uncharacterized protein n=1 Tax=Portunus trituberculatus TaxID=210409 RepID=A0A5B7JWJ2_PORTR|nr:hypothetical protein [Portunus trituberculatus]